MKLYLQNIVTGLLTGSVLIYASSSWSVEQTQENVKVTSLAVELATAKVTLDVMPARSPCDVYLSLDLAHTVNGFVNKLHYSMLLTAMSVGQNLDVRYDDVSCAINLVKMQ